MQQLKSAVVQGIFAFGYVVNEEDHLQGNEHEEAAAHVLDEVVVPPCELNCIIAGLHIANREEVEERIGDEEHLHLREADQGVVDVMLDGVAPHSEKPNTLEEHDEAHLLMVGLPLRDAEHDDHEEDSNHSEGNSHYFGGDVIGESPIVRTREFRVRQLEYVGCRSVRDVVFTQHRPTREVYLDEASREIDVLHVVGHHDDVLGPADS